MGDLIAFDKKDFEITKQGEIKLDEAGKPIFKERIEWFTDGPQIMALWTACKTALEGSIVFHDDLDATFKIMETLAKKHKDTNKKYRMSLPINYFVGLRHILNQCRAASLFDSDKKLENAMYELELWFSERIDAYHGIKEREAVEENLSPNDIVSSPSKSVKLLETQSDKDQ